MENVLSKPELVESILLQLPMSDLLVNAPRVSKRFNSIISSSPSIQRMLFFAPEQSKNSYKTLREWTPNPLLCKAFPPWFLNRPFSTYDMCDYQDFLRLDWNSSKQKIAAFVRREASWRRMLVTQPPVTDLGIIQYTHEQLADMQQSIVVKFVEGITMATIYDQIEDYLIRHSPVSSFAVQWHLVPEHENAPHVTLHLSYVFQCIVDSMGQGFRYRHRGPGRGKKIEWVFKSEDSQPLMINFK